MFQRIPDVEACPEITFWCWGCLPFWNTDCLDRPLSNFPLLQLTSKLQMNGNIRWGQVPVGGVAMSLLSI